MKEKSIPSQSLIANVSHDYADIYSIIMEDKNQEIKIEDLIRFGKSPWWVSALMRFRDIVVKLFGLKTSSSTVIKKEEKVILKKGLQLGIFKVSDFNNREVVFSENDKHLKFYLSIFLDKTIHEKSNVIASTLVIYNNNLGRIYFSVVKPFHKLIVPSMLKSMVKNLEELN